MIIYNVTVNVEDSIHDDWFRWMKDVHIPDVLATGMFVDAKMLRLLTQVEGATGISYAIQYRCQNMETYEEYQKKYAPKLQKEHTDRYQGKFYAFRTMLEEV